MSTDRDAAIGPPADAPLPWMAHDAGVRDCGGDLIGWFVGARHAAYAAHAANALPGLVEMARKLVSAADKISFADYSEAVEQARDLLAALPGEVRG